MNVCRSLYLVIFIPSSFPRVNLFFLSLIFFFLSIPFSHVNYLPFPSPTHYFFSHFPCQLFPFPSLLPTPTLFFLSVPFSHFIYSFSLPHVFFLLFLSSILRILPLSLSYQFLFLRPFPFSPMSIPSVTCSLYLVLPFLFSTHISFLFSLFPLRFTFCFPLLPIILINLTNPAFCISQTNFFPFPL